MRMNGYGISLKSIPYGEDSVFLILVNFKEIGYKEDHSMGWGKTFIGRDVFEKDCH